MSNSDAWQLSKENWIYDKNVNLKEKNKKIVLVTFMLSPRGNPYKGLYGEAAPERGSFFRLQVMTGYGIHELKYMKGQENLSNK